ncbi:putative Snapin/Pallidin [Blattamonas nauphoetae]|uniref:Biogenesis of lysosome-related organelles complex 1 subunit 7 n=1 Tax=Blattamonas nauphoetae TaxID=2049346 RepID=A0ABQ9X7D3_9EUKA|nr:putative Snapin/Pallidin [Blattamonas nauphoetae]
MTEPEKTEETQEPVEQQPVEVEQSQQPTQQDAQLQNVDYFRNGLESLLVPHLETCQQDINTIYEGQDRILNELKRMEQAMMKLNSFKDIPKLNSYSDRVKQCRKRVTNISNTLNTIQARVTRMKEIQQQKQLAPKPQAAPQ